jgi:hypothetical protein
VLAADGRELREPAAFNFDPQPRERLKLTLPPGRLTVVEVVEPAR